MDKVKNNKKSIFKKTTLCLVAFLVSLFALIPFVPSKKINSVNADEMTITYNYNGSSWLTLGIFDNTKFTFVNSRIEFQTTASTTNVQFFVKQWVVDDDAVSTYGTAQYAATGYWTGTTYHASSLVFNDNGLYSSNFSLTGAVDSYWLRLVRMPIGSSEFTIICRIERSSSFIGSVSYITICAVDYVGNSYSQFGQNFTKLIQVGYYDANDNYITYAFPTLDEYALNFSSRTYYVSDVDSNDYKDGYDKGYQSGLIDGNSSGYNDGYNVGLTEGYNNGYNVGVNDSNQYSFYNLFGAVLDAPVKVFSSLFNFNLLGVNLLGLITGLFTLAVIIVIIKKVMGGK